MNLAKTLPFVLALGLVAAPARAENEPKPSLKGLTAAKVSISLSQALVDAGVDGAQLRTLVELQLRQAGLKVDPSLSDTELSVEITGVQGPGTDVYACMLSVCLFQTVKVQSNNEDVTGCVWGPGLYVLYLPNNLQGELFNTTRDKLNEFLNDWLRVNPR